jgi:transcriptional regulator with XRE-family HTH domain
MPAALANSVTRGFSIAACSHITDFCASPKIRIMRNDFDFSRAYYTDMDEKPPHYLKEWRKFRRMTQDKLADAVDTSKSVISDLERGNLQLSPKWLRKLAPILGTQPGHILDHDPNDLDTDVIEIWSRIDDKVQAMKVLQSFARDGTNG